MMPWLKLTAASALLFCALGLWSWGQSHKLARLEAQATRLSEELNETQAALDYVVEDRRRVIAALEAARRAEQARASALESALKTIESAPEHDDAPVAPVLRRALDGLTP